jgi:hypothetical protein
MPKTPKVVSIRKTPNKAKLIAKDPEGQRVIIGIGRQRIAYDFYTRITHLPPETGDQPAAILPFTDSIGARAGRRRQLRTVISCP